MRKRILVLILCTLFTPFVLSAATPDVMAPVRQFIDGFNKGDTKTAFAAYATGEISIVDEFPPYRWLGPHAPQEWSAAYDKHAQATGVTDGAVKYGEPTRTEIANNAAYVIIPTTYLYKEHGHPMAEEGQVALILHLQAGAWKISGWTWTGVKPHPAK